MTTGSATNGGRVSLDEPIRTSPGAVMPHEGLLPAAPAGATPPAESVDGGVADLQAQLDDLEVRYRGIIDRLPVVIYINGVGHEISPST